jgi:dienelactone hydrolase
MWRQRMTEWVAEAGQVIDYLSTRGDIDPDRIAYNGNSFGASTALPVLSMERRFRAALLTLAGFPQAMYPPETLALNHAPRSTLPVLMVGAEDDYIFPRETAQEPHFNPLGTPAEDNRHLIYEMGHGPLPTGQTLRDVLPWLDQYLGPMD